MRVELNIVGPTFGENGSWHIKWFYTKGGGGCWGELRSKQRVLSHDDMHLKFFCFTKIERQLRWPLLFRTLDNDTILISCSPDPFLYETQIDLR